MAEKPPFLFSIDLEDVRSMVPEGHRYAERVPALISRYGALLERHRVRCTFFTVGDVARRYPSLIRELEDAGHEIACHGRDHAPLDRLDPARFRADLERNLEDLARAGCRAVRGFRAPVFSLTRETRWAWDVMAELGLRYSSSVLPASHPLYGWPGFARECSLTESGVWELPVTLTRIPGFDLPFAGGTYLRALPFALVRALFQREIRRGRAVVGYAHPFDIDPEQERFAHPELGGSRLYQRIMYWNRAGMLGRIERLLALGAPIVPYGDYVARLSAGAPPRRPS
jgi:polysaccharide deacetylase family protein (PEP-CTERM system associated)